MAAATAGHAFYPAVVALGSRGRRAPVPADPETWPAVTVLVPAYNEANCIEAKVRDVFANGYPGDLEVLVVADGDPETAARAEQAGATVLTADERLGKSQALNLGFSKASTPVVVLSDANNSFAPGAIAAMVRYFSDSRVGAVAGAKVEADGTGEDLYWRFESWLKGREWAMGSTIGLVGEIAAVRTDAFEPIPADIAVDDLWLALDLSARGFVVAYEPEAKAYEPPAHTTGQQWERRTRIVAGALHVFQLRRAQLLPTGGLVTGQIWGHRLARYTLGPLAHVALLVAALRRVRTSWLARLFLLGHVVAAWSLARDAARQSPDAWTPPVAGDAGTAARGPTGARGAAPAPRPTLGRRLSQVLAQGVFLDAVAIGGMIRYLRGDRPARWHTVRR
jgi:cellulose synthase/poly-beta-1,6-N-acetylglucosamine synthase-like glycosyltransferase